VIYVTLFKHVSAIYIYVYEPLTILYNFVHMLVYQEDEEEDVSSCWMTLGTEEDTLI
jgi:hypothetical protein